MTDRRELFATLRARQPHGAPPAAAISVPALVCTWLDAGPRRFDGADRATLDALCRQIDVRHKVSNSYKSDWKREDPEAPAPAAVVSGLVAVLLANAVDVGAVGTFGTSEHDGEHNDGWGLKCTNSALKALDLHADLPLGPQLRAWAMERLDAVRTGSAGQS